ncbi:hypothetical protein JL720_7777 [Aureococcus anophagefferens]|nr:hypothetical protein JL720_7777 [Aureococcus anophagefferens]
MALSARALRLPAPSAVARRCLASATSPVCLTWGEGTEGQLGHTPFALSGVLQQYAELAPRQLEGFVLRDVACGTNHTLAVDGDGAVWSWGKSDFGKCGHGDDADCKAPAPPRGADVVAVACGESHSLALDSDGRVYSWGWGGSWLSGGGQLGSGDRGHRYAPAPVAGALEGACVASLGAGEGHSVFLTDDGEVWTCGAGEHGRNGNGGSATPRRTRRGADDVDVVQLEAGSAFTICRDSTGVVRVWGRNDQGQLGLGGGLAMDAYARGPAAPIDLPDGSPSRRSTSPRATATPPSSRHPETSSSGARRTRSSPRRTSSRATAPAPEPVAVHCGGAYTLAETADGDLYSFGAGSSKCLGHGDKQRHPHPKKVAALDGFRLAKLSCGYRHCAVLGTW